jgi:hypothetical protein
MVLPDRMNSRLNLGSVHKAFREITPTRESDIGDLLTSTFRLTSALMMRISGTRTEPGSTAAPAVRGVTPITREAL